MNADQRGWQMNGNRAVAGKPTALRILVLVLALIAMLGVATASTSPTHFHLKPPAGGCDVCFAVHVAYLESSSPGVPVPAPQIHGMQREAAAISGYQLFRSRASLTRGPPAYNQTAA